jgi:hypothetical protein
VDRAFALFRQGRLWMLNESRHRRTIREHVVSGLTPVTSSRLGLPLGRRDHRWMSPARMPQRAFRRDLHNARIRWQSSTSDCASMVFPGCAHRRSIMLTLVSGNAKGARMLGRRPHPGGSALSDKVACVREGRRTDAKASATGVLCGTKSRRRCHPALTAIEALMALALISRDRADA